MILCVLFCSLFIAADCITANGFQECRDISLLSDQKRGTALDHCLNGCPWLEFWLVLHRWLDGDHLCGEDL